jgi:hypothetical protein
MVLHKEKIICRKDKIRFIDRKDMPLKILEIEYESPYFIRLFRKGNIFKEIEYDKFREICIGRNLFFAKLDINPRKVI